MATDSCVSGFTLDQDNQSGSLFSQTEISVSHTTRSVTPTGQDNILSENFSPDIIEPSDDELSNCSFRVKPNRRHLTALRNVDFSDPRLSNEVRTDYSSGSDDVYIPETPFSDTSSEITDLHNIESLISDVQASTSIQDKNQESLSSCLLYTSRCV